VTASKPRRFSVLLLILVFAPIEGWASACADNDVRLQVLGSGGPEFGDNRASSSYLIWQNGKAKVLIDAGSGSSLNFEQSGAKIEDLQAVVFTHFHVDHSAAFPALIKASFFTKRDRDLPVFGPEGNHLMPSASQFVEKLLGEDGAFRYLSNYVEGSRDSAYHLLPHDVPLEKGKMVTFKLTESLSLQATPVHHGPVAAVAWRVNILDCAVTFSGDMSNTYQSLPGLAKNSDILLAHNAIPEGATGVARVLHMPPSEIGKIASAAEVKKLVLSHRMLRTTGIEADTLETIKQFYAGPVSFADDMQVFLLE